MVAHPLRWQLLTALAGSDLRVRELTERVGEPQNLVSYHLRLLRDGGLVRSRRSSFDGRDTYYHLDLDRCATALTSTGAAVHPALRLVPHPLTAPPDDVRVLVSCTGNSARSPIAEALLRRHGVAVTSAGSDPKPQVHPLAVRVLREEFGLDAAGHRPRPFPRDRFDLVVTLCDKVREVCPDFGGERVHWSVPEPVGHRDFVRAAGEIDTRVRHLLPVLAAGRKG
ncbi:ArsR family transcriptional regulator [Lentzea sp. NPDC059081]|uniref:arsenate reductase/protein-tyrosine-phosphatase family protein n=1 Tax=Lentzea sp. NPDC059081 TaxID=3346719 RepID=UPI0036B1001A